MRGRHGIGPLFPGSRPRCWLQHGSRTRTRWLLHYDRLCRYYHCSPVQERRTTQTTPQRPIQGGTTPDGIAVPAKRDACRSGCCSRDDGRRWLRRDGADAPSSPRDDNCVPVGQGAHQRQCACTTELQRLNTSEPHSAGDGTHGQRNGHGSVNSPADASSPVAPRPRSSAARTRATVQSHT